MNLPLPKTARRNKPWLLLWVLPYLLLGIAGGAHNHAFGSAGLSAPETHLALGSCVAHQSSSLADLTAHFECFACQWANHATALCATPAGLSADFSSASLHATASCVLTPRFYRTGSIRGPPSL